MSAEILVASYLRIASEDLAGARQLSTTGNRNAMYLCSQAAEKIIRAVLTSEGKNAGIKHQLDELVDIERERANRWRGEHVLRWFPFPRTPKEIRNRNADSAGHQPA